MRKVGEKRISADGCTSIWLKKDTDTGSYIVCECDRNDIWKEKYFGCLVTHSLKEARAFIKDEYDI